MTLSILDFYLQQLEKDWSLFVKSKYQKIQNQSSEPLSLKFWASEGIKKQQFIVASIKRIEFVWNNRRNNRLWYLLADPTIDIDAIVFKSHEEVHEEALILVRETPQLGYWLN